MSDKNWKRAERTIAKLLGGIRNPVNGRGDEPDISHPKYSIEVKNRALPQWINHGFDQAVFTGGGDKIPIVVIHEPDSRFDSCRVLIKLKDFLELTCEEEN